MIKKIDFGLSKYQICFVGCRKKVVCDDKNSNLFLLHKTKSFNLKNIRFVFEELKKWFFIIEKSDLFL